MPYSSTPYTQFSYTFLNEKNVCINGYYQTNGDRFATAQVRMILPPLQNDSNNNSINTTTSSAAVAVSSRCTVTNDYYCDITRMKQFETNLEQYCHLVGTEYSYNSFDECDAFDAATAFNDTMPSIIWPPYRTSQGQYDLLIRDKRCNVTPDPNANTDPGKSLAIAVFIGVVFLLVGYMLGKKYRPSSTKITNTMTDPLL